MSAQLVIELTNGNKLFFGGRGVVKGLSEVAVGEQTAMATAGNFHAALANLADLAGMLELTGGSPAQAARQSRNAIWSFTQRRVRFVDTLRGREAEFKVTLTWGKQ